MWLVQTNDGQQSVLKFVFISNLSVEPNHHFSDPQKCLSKLGVLLRYSRFYLSFCRDTEKKGRKMSLSFRSFFRIYFFLVFFSVLFPSLFYETQDKGNQSRLLEILNAAWRIRRARALAEFLDFLGNSKSFLPSQLIRR